MRSTQPKASSWRAHWTRLSPLFDFPEDIHKVIYTTNAIESLNMTLRKVTSNHRIFPSDEAVYKVVYLAIRNIEKPVDDADPRLEACTQSLCGGICTC
jgi:putative transposase